MKFDRFVAILAIATLTLVIVLGTVTKARADTHCEDVANVTMALATLRDDGIRADVVYQYLIEGGNWTTEQARVVIYRIWVLEVDRTPADLGSEAWLLCEKSNA